MKQIEFIEFIEQTNEVSNNQELYRIFKKTLHSAGYNQVTYNFLTDHITQGLGSKYGILKECPEDWFKHYFANSYQYIDPRASFACVYRKAFVWKRIEEFVCLSKKEKQIIHELDEMSLHDGVVVPLFGVAGEFAAVTISRSCKDAEPDSTTLSLIQAVVNQFHQCYLAINRDKRLSLGGEIRLTPREKEILQWCASGKSNWEISAILGISENGVEYHLRNIYQKMGVNNRVNAVIYAIKSGCIKL